MIVTKKQRLEDLTVDELLTLIEEGTGCGCCGGEPARTIEAVYVIREKLKKPEGVEVKNEGHKAGTRAGAE